MKILLSNFKKGEAKIRITSRDDLWYLSQIIDEGDTIQGETERKIKIGEGENLKVVRRNVFLSIVVEKTEFHKQNDVLRVAGTIVDGPDDVPRGSHHTFNVEIDTNITILKKQWLGYQIEKLQEASADAKPSVLLVVFDREEVHFAYATAYGYEYLSEIKGDVQRKGDDKKIESTFYHDIMQQIKTYVERQNIQKVVVASPAFWKEYFIKQLTDDSLKKKIIIATCSSADKTAFNEVLKRPEVETALKESRVVEEVTLVEELLKEVLHGTKAKYGLKAVSEAANNGEIKTILITDGYIRKTRDENTFGEVDAVLKVVDSMKGNIKIISSEHDGGKKLDGLGGIAAILRYAVA